jgi:hypothetical protein
LLVAAGRRNSQTKEGDLLIWHWTTNLVPRKAVFYFRQRANDDEDKDAENGSDMSRSALFLRWAAWKIVEYGGGVQP